MFKGLNRYIKTEEGNSMVLVVFITLCCTIIMGTVMYVTFTQVEFSQAYKKSSNIDILAMSGAEKGISLLNNEINQKLETWVKEVSKNILMDDPATPEIEYQNNLYYDGSTYNGFYHLKESGVGGSDQLFIKKIAEKITGNFSSPVTYEYEVEQDAVKYKVTVAIDFTSDTIISTALRLDNGNTSVVSATFGLGTYATNNEILYEQYGWNNDVPSKFSNAILSFGDLIVKEGSRLTVNGTTNDLGNVTVKGYSPNPSDINNQGDDYGGIYVMNGSQLQTNHANAYTKSNIHTKRTYGPSVVASGNASTINIQGNAIANSISIEDNFYFNNEGRDLSAIQDYINYEAYDEAKMTKDNTIHITKDAYTYNDVNIARYVKDSSITVDNNVFGVTGEDLNLNPTNNSGIFNQGTGGSIIHIGHAAFVYGKIFASYDDKFFRLQESIGAPYDDVYEKIEAYHDQFNANYIADFETLISQIKVINNKVKFSNGFKGYTVGYVSANDKYYKIASGQLQHKTAAGWTDITSLGSNMWSAINSINKEQPFFMDGYTASGLDETDIKNALHNLSNTNWDSEDVQTVWEHGVKGYMDKKLEVLDNTYVYADAIKSTDTYPTTDSNNPIMIIRPTDPVPLTTEIDLSKFKKDGGYVASIIIDTRTNGEIKFVNGDTFNGFIYTNGKLIFDNTITINGAIVAGNYKSNVPQTILQDIEAGKYAGVVVTDGAQVTVNYDISQLLKVRTDDFSLRRKAYDYLMLTNYHTASSRVDTIAAMLKDLKIATNSAISVDVNDAYKIKFKINGLKYTD